MDEFQKFLAASNTNLDIKIGSEQANTPHLLSWAGSVRFQTNQLLAVLGPTVSFRKLKVLAGSQKA